MKRKKAPFIQLFLSILLWLCIWQIASMALDMEFLLVSPLTAGKRFCELAVTPAFWITLGNTCLRILTGFLIATAAGILTAALSQWKEWIGVFLSPLVLAIRTVPVVSFVILALILFSSRYLSVLISFLISFPVIYENLRKGIQSCDRKLLEMAAVFRIPFFRRIRSVYALQMFPYFRAAFTTGLGLAWKAGVAAEVIGMPKGSIGERMQQAKIYLASADLIAWTAAAVLCCQGMTILGSRLLGQAEALLSGKTLWKR